MARPLKVWKVVAVGNALLLAGGLIAYKAGALAPIRPQQQDDAQLGGSKYYKFTGLEPAGTPQTVPPTTRAFMPEEARLMAGSKSYSGVVTISPGTLSPSTDPPPPAGQQPIALPPASPDTPPAGVSSEPPDTVNLKLLEKAAQSQYRMHLSSSKSITIQPELTTPLLQLVFPDYKPPLPPSFSTAKPPIK